MAENIPCVEELQSLEALAAADAVTAAGSVPIEINIGQRGTMHGEPRCSYSEAYTVWATGMYSHMWPVLEQHVSCRYINYFHHNH